MRKPNAVLPADKQVLMAVMSQLILCQYATSTIGKFLSCIMTKYRQFGYPSPLLYREMGSWLLGLKKNTSSGVKTKMRLTPIHIRLIASLPTISFMLERDSILVQLGTLGAFQKSELVALNVCDWIVNRECDAKGESCGAMVFVKRQKNNQEGKERWKGGPLCLVKRIESYLHWANLRTNAACLKWKDVALRTSPCATCGPLFSMVYGGTRFNAKRERISSKHITNAIARMLAIVQVDDVGLHQNQCGRVAYRQPKGRACQRPCGANRAVTKAMHTKRTRRTTVQTQKTTRTCHGVSRQEGSVRTTRTDSRKCSACKNVRCLQRLRQASKWLDQTR